METSPLELALFALIVLLPVVVGMAWVTWISMGRMANLASRGLGMAEEMQRHAWSMELSKNPDRAQLAGQLEQVGNPDYLRAVRQDPTPAGGTFYPDEAALQQQG